MELLTYASKHYIFHFEQDSYAHVHIAEIASMQEACYTYITEVLNVDFPFTIHYFLCETSKRVGEIYGDGEPCNGFAAPPDHIYAVCNDEVQCIGMHEDAHLISYYINRPESAALREGLAMFFDRKWYGISNMEWAGLYLQQDFIPPLRVMLDDECFFGMSDTHSYPIMGAFTEYLILTYGYEAYRQLYAGKGAPILRIAEVYGRSIEQMDEDFRSYLRIFRMDECVVQRMKALLET